MNKTFRTIVVEDERLPRLSLIQKLEGVKGVKGVSRV